MKKLFSVFLVALTLAACGGGGGSSGGTSGSSSASSTPPASTAATANVVNVTVDKTYDFINAPYVSLTVCAPGTNNCATIDHVMVDTGSVGLRLLRSALPVSLGLTNATDPVEGNTLAECAEFASGHAWGPISTVDLKIAGETASALPMQIMDESFASVPADCASFGPDLASKGASSFGAKGIIGVNFLHRDCMNACRSTTDTVYYDCVGSSCQGVPIPVANQLPNPVSEFASDNNGLTLTFPAIPAGGAASVTGTMTFGIDTQSNNASGTGTEIPVGFTATVNTLYNGQMMGAIVDSGTGTYSLPETPIAQCPSSWSSITWFCPAEPTTVTASMMLTPDSNFDVQFNIANAMSELGNSNAAHEGVGEDVSLFGVSLFDIGMPFFYGKTITFSIEKSDDFFDGSPTPYLVIQS